MCVFLTFCAAGILVLTQIINPFRTIQFNYKDQFGLAYGGLRGAICFALVFTLPDDINRKNLFVTASIAMVIFTVFIQVTPLGFTFYTKMQHLQHVAFSMSIY